MFESAWAESPLIFDGSGRQDFNRIRIVRFADRQKLAAPINLVGFRVVSRIVWACWKSRAKSLRERYLCLP